MVYEPRSRYVSNQMPSNSSMAPLLSMSLASSQTGGGVPKMVQLRCSIASVISTTPLSLWSPRRSGTASAPGSEGTGEDQSEECEAEKGLERFHVSILRYLNALGEKYAQ